ncbi:ubiquitin carboxyl-terminal hydrolase 53 [Brachyhypopomus gauderio]|uniref:ubiquitin carboxyl-terminal hydrolase 53 n=1 Tax=Brachyhypopomus gauderio TaxID=698409 RepID=UPI00404336FF
MAWVKFFRKPGGNLGKVYQPGSMLSLAPTKGLLNEPGQNSCFLNSAVQVLWHLDIFRRSLRQLPTHYCLGESCIFCALKGIFSQFQFSRERVLPSDNLRHALAETFKDEQRFQLGFMDDAAECFENILQRIHLHIVPDVETDTCTSKSCITHQKFAMTLYEQCVCRSCGASSDPLPFTELVHYVSTTALCQQFFEKKDERFSELLQTASTIGDLRNCPSNCGQRIRIRRVLMNSPQIVTIGFVWDAEQSDLTEDVIRSLGPHLSLSGLFYQVTDENAKKSDLQLVGMICYSSRHYCAFAFHTKSSKWVFFDDATVKEVGTKWKDVVTKCIRGHFQPLLLFYSNPEGGAVTIDDPPRTNNAATNPKNTVNGDAPGTPLLSSKKLELTRENLTALLSGHGTLKRTGQALAAFKRGNNQTSGGRGPVKLNNADPKSYLHELSREAQHMNFIKKDLDRAQGKPQTQRPMDTVSEKSYSRSLSPPESRFKNVEARLYSSQGRGPTRVDRSPRTAPRAAHTPRSHSQPRASQPRIALQPPPGRLPPSVDFSNGYDTDSSQDSRERPGAARRGNRVWRPTREALNVDSILGAGGRGGAGDRHLPPGLRQRTSGQQRAPNVPAWGGRDDDKPTSLMTIYEDEQRNDMGSRSSLDSDGRDKDRPKGAINNLGVRTDAWKAQRIESGYESSDRLSNGSTNLDSPVVENLSSKDMRPFPEVSLSRELNHHRRYEDSKPEVPRMPFSYGNIHGKSHFNHELNHVQRRIFQHAPDHLERTEKPLCEPNDRSVTPFVHQTSSSEWSTSHRFGHTSAPPLPPKTYTQRAENRAGLLQDSAPHKGPTRSRISPERWTESSSEPHMHSSSDTSSKSGSSDQERADLSASESDAWVDSPVTGECVIPTTYFSVDSCMTDTYRDKYHKKRPALYRTTDSKTADHTSSGESDHGETMSPAPSDMEFLDLPRTKQETAYVSKTIAKWNPVSVKGLDEHGFL